MSKDPLYKVAYDDAVRARSEQQAVIESFRTRAGLLFSATAIATSFLGAQALRGGRLNLSSWLALLCFVAVASVSLAVLWPRKWEGGADPREVIQTYIEAPEVAPIEELQRDLSIYIYDRIPHMAEPRKRTSGVQPKRGPSPIVVEPGMTLGEALRLLLPRRWRQRLASRDRSA